MAIVSVILHIYELNFVVVKIYISKPSMFAVQHYLYFVASASTESPGAYPSWIKGTVVSLANPCRSEHRRVMPFQEGKGPEISFQK